MIFYNKKSGVNKKKFKFQKTLKSKQRKARQTEEDKKNKYVYINKLRYLHNFLEHL